MASINKKTEPIYTYEGAAAQHINKYQQLQRAVLSCLLWENEFYEDGVSIADRIKGLIKQVPADKVAELAVFARTQGNLRHVPLLIVREMARLSTHKHLVADTLEKVIQRADELTEFLAIYWKEEKQSLSMQVKRGLARAFTKFNEYQLAKYNRDGAIKLRDVLFLCHAKPKDNAQEVLWKALINNELKTPDTWEVALSAGEDKKATWERLINDDKLGGLALLRNLRNILYAGVDKAVIRKSLESFNTSKILPFRFISAALAVPDLEPSLEIGMLKCLSQAERLKGKTILIVDVSGSMYASKISAKSELDRAKVACALAILIREICEDPVIYATAGSDYARVHATQKVPPRRGFALSDSIYNLCRPLGGGGIFLTQVMDYVKDVEKEADRIIVITDEQDCDQKLSPGKADAFGKHNYLINVASAKNGIGYGKWTHIDGFSESVVKYISTLEMSGVQPCGNQ